MKKLRQKYKTEKDNARKSGNNRKKPWKYFEQMHSFLSHKHNVTPAALIDTMAVGEKDDEISLQTTETCISDDNQKKDHNGIINTVFYSVTVHKVYMFSQYNLEFKEVSIRDLYASG